MIKRNFSSGLLFRIKVLIPGILPLFFLITSVIAAVSCREEVIAPGNLIGVKNLAVRENQRNYFTFMIEAENLSVSYPDSLRLYTYACLVNVKSTEYKSGEARVELMNEEGETVILENVSDNRDKEYYYNGVSKPKWTSVRFENFSGNLVFEIRKSF
ncbi:MAG: hypothetical protein AB9882_05905 [Ignavibacteriaceae bacterium]